MLFNSLQFIVFFPIVVAAYFALNPKFRWILLLIASYYFYMCWNYKYVVLIAITTSVNYLAGIGISKSKSKFFRILYLTTGLVVSLGILFFFKYFNFFGESLNFIFEKINIFYRVPSYHYLLPVGISFFTFQTLSYTIDVYFKKQEVEYHFGIFALYVSFFPQLVAGPIERSTNLLPQFYKKNSINYERIRDGLVIMLWGLLKKVVIADRISEYVNIVYGSPDNFTGSHLILATVFFSIQIYCDFSGYSDIAIGTAKIMGYDLMTNFRRPYFAQNIREFWQRWHISLSTWFRDYFYIPLGGNRVSKGRNYFNLFSTFLVSGLWHGANWTFVIWGALHGFYSIFALFTKKLRTKLNNIVGITKFPKFHSLLNIVITYILVYFSWIFFRAANLQDAITVIKNMFIFKSSVSLNLFKFSADLYISLISIILFLLIEVFTERNILIGKLKRVSPILKVTLFVILLFIIFIFGEWNEADFLYFQF